MEIIKAKIKDIDNVVKLALLLWKNYTYTYLYEEIKKSFISDNQFFFIAYEKQYPAGFAHCSFRHDYVEGTSGGTVGYLEGIYIVPEYRSKGLAKSLLKHCEDFSQKNGCTEFASDCELHNTESYNFHIATGFEEANKIVCFKKKI